MAQSATIFRASSGLNNKHDPARIAWNAETGETELSVAVNVVHCPLGRIFRRQGHTPVMVGDYHSLCGCHSYALAVKGNALVVIDRGFTDIPIRNVTMGARMRYAEGHDGQQSVFYYANGFELGKVIDRISYPWEMPAEHYGPASTKALSGPPDGATILDIWYGRLWAIVGNTAYPSEPFSFSEFAMGENFLPFQSRIRLFRGVRGGIWVSTESEVAFLPGDRPENLGFKHVAPYPAIEGTDVIAPASRVSQQIQGNVIVFTATAGICVAGDDGFFANMTEDRLCYPSGSHGAAYYHDGQYVVMIEP